MLTLVLAEPSAVVLVALSTANERSEVAFIVCGLPLVVSMVTSHMPMIGALMGSGITVLTTTSVDSLSRFGAVGTSDSALKSKFSVQTWFGILQQISVE